MCVCGGGGRLGGWLVDREQIKRRTPLHSTPTPTLLYFHHIMRCPSLELKHIFSMLHCICKDIKY